MSEEKGAPPAGPPPAPKGRGYAESKTPPLGQVGMGVNYKKIPQTARILTGTKEGIPVGQHPTPANSVKGTPPYTKPRDKEPSKVLKESQKENFLQKSPTRQMGKVGKRRGAPPVGDPTPPLPRRGLMEQ